MLQLVSSVTEANEAKIIVKEVPNPVDGDLKPDEVVVRIEACPVNPADMISLAPPGDFKAAKLTENELTYPMDKRFAKFFAGMVNKFVPTGSEGAGIVVKAGTSPEAQKLLNKVVAVSSAVPGVYAQFVKAPLASVLPHLEGTTVEEAASSFVNPVTALCIIDNVKAQGHKAFIHTAAASQLGIMLVKLSQKENIPIVTIVRKESQEKTLKALGVKYIVRSDKPTFMADLIKACAETKASCAFDAIGGGDMTNTLLTAMEQGALTYAEAGPVSYYGTKVYKQVFIYGGLNAAPTTLGRAYGMCWGVNAWSMPNYIETLKKEKVQEIFGSVAMNIKTIFKTEYYKRVSFKEMIEVENFIEMNAKESGKKFLLLPQK